MSPISKEERQLQLESTPRAGTSFSNVQEQFITYLYARDTFPAKFALDIGCGEGYGSFCLSGKARVFAIDFSLHALFTLKDRYLERTIWPLCMDATRLGLKDKMFDLIMASHIIEHFVQHDRDVFLSELVRVMHPAGFAIIATPNHPEGLRYQQAGFHRILYDESSLRRVLKPYFTSVEIRGVRARKIFSLVRPALRLGKTVLQHMGLLSFKSFQETIAATSTASTKMNFEVSDSLNEAKNLLAICSGPIMS